MARTSIAIRSSSLPTWRRATRNRQFFRAATRGSSPADIWDLLTAGNREPLPSEADLAALPQTILREVGVEGYSLARRRLAAVSTLATLAVGTATSGTVGQKLAVHVLKRIARIAGLTTDVSKAPVDLARLGAIGRRDDDGEVVHGDLDNEEAEVDEDDELRPSEFSYEDFDYDGLNDDGDASDLDRDDVQ